MFDAAEIRGGLQRELNRLLAEEEAAAHHVATPPSTGSNPMTTAGSSPPTSVSTLPALQHLDHSPQEVVMSEAASHIRVHVERIATTRQLQLEEEALQKLQKERERRAHYVVLRAAIESEEETCRSHVETEEASFWESRHKALKTERSRLTYQERMRSFAAKQAIDNAAIQQHDAGTQGDLDALLAEEYAPYKGAATIAIQRRIEREERTQFWDDLRRKRTFPLFERDLAGNTGPSTGALSSSQVDWHHPRAMRTGGSMLMMSGSANVSNSASESGGGYVATSPYDSRLTDAFINDS